MVYYYALQDVPAGTTITSSTYWSTLDDYAETLTDPEGDPSTFEPPSADSLDTLSVPPDESPKMIVASGVLRVHTSTTHTLFLKNNGTLWGMGRNQWGELGLGNPHANYDDNSTSPAIYQMPLRLPWML